MLHFFLIFFTEIFLKKHYKIEKISKKKAKIRHPLAKEFEYL